MRRFEWQKVNKVYFFGSLALVIILVLASFIGYVWWFWAKADSFRETLQKDGFTIIQAESGPIPSFMWLPPPASYTLITYQDQTQFINEAHRLAGIIYQLDTFQFYAVNDYTDSACEYTVPHPTFLDTLIGVSYLIEFPLIFLLPVLVLVILAAIALLMEKISEKRRTRSTR